MHAAEVLICILCDQAGNIYYELLKTVTMITAKRNRAQLVRLSQDVREKRAQYKWRNGRVILDHDEAWPDSTEPSKRKRT